MEDVLLIYNHGKTDGPCRHDLSKAIINEKTKFLINEGWVFTYPPQNVTGNSNRSMMQDPAADYRVGWHYHSAYEEACRRKKPQQATFDFG